MHKTLYHITQLILLRYGANCYKAYVNYVTIIHRRLSRTHIYAYVLVTENKKDANPVICAHLLC